MNDVFPLITSILSLLGITFAIVTYITRVIRIEEQAKNNKENINKLVEENKELRKSYTEISHKRETDVVTFVEIAGGLGASVKSLDSSIQNFNRSVEKLEGVIREHDKDIIRLQEQNSRK